MARWKKKCILYKAFCCFFVPLKGTLSVTVRKVLNDYELMKLAEDIGEKWEQLAIHLRFTRQDIFRFKQDNTSVLMAIHAMLVEWRQRQYDQDAVKQVGKELSHALACCGRSDLSQKVDNLYSNANVQNLRHSNVIRGEPVAEVGLTAHPDTNNWGQNEILS